MALSTTYSSGNYTFLYQMNNINYFATGNVTAAAMNSAASTLGTRMTCTDVKESNYDSNLVTTGVEKMGVDLGCFFSNATDALSSSKIQGAITVYHLVPDQ